VRRLQLARQPDLAFTFLMLNSGKDSLHCETSPHDDSDDWATKFPVPKGAESPLDVLLSAYSGDDDAAAERFWERLRTEAPTRRLGRANALVARSLSAPEASLEGESAAAVELQATGWVAWVDRCLPGEGSLLHPPPRLHAQCELMRQWVFNTEEQVGASRSARYSGCKSRASRASRPMRPGGPEL
jgi:hypothetical protein